MKWFRRIFGTPTRDELAELVIGVLRQTGATDIEYDAAIFQLRLKTSGGGQGFKNLSNAHLVYAAARPWHRGAVLRRFAATSWEIAPAATWDEAAPRLRPAVRSPYLFGSALLQARLAGFQGSLPAFRDLTGQVSVTLVEDHQEHMALVAPSSLEKWGVSFDEALATALTNLEAVSAPRWTNPFPGVYVSAWQDDYDASRLLLDSVLTGLDLPGVPVALVPHRSCLIVTGSEDDEAVARALALTEAQSEAPGLISALPLRQTPSGWTAWEPGARHPSRETFQRLRIQELGGLYNDQKQLLDAVHEKEEIDIYVASFSAFRQGETGAVQSLCTWTRDVLSLLPRTDRIAFCDVDRPEGEQILGFFDWEAVEARCGDLMPRTEDIPVRYRVEQSAFPTEEDFAALGKGR
jgi:hypothetical protein